MIYYSNKVKGLTKGLLCLQSVLQAVENSRVCDCRLP